MTKKKKIIYIAVSAVALLAIIAGIFFIMAQNANSKKYDDYFHDAQQYYDIGDYKNAVTYLKRAVEINATDESVLLLADCYVKLDDLSGAVNVLERYASKSEAVKTRLDEIKNSTDAGDDVTIAGETFKAEAVTVALSGKGLKSADIADIAKLTGLQSATLSKNAIEDISCLKGLTNLEVLDLSDNKISDLSALSGLTKLRTLYLDNNADIKDFSPLLSLKNLTMLSIKGIDIMEGQLKEIEDAIPGCRVHSEKASQDIVDISMGGVTFKSDVTVLDLSNSGIRDISDLSKCEGLTKLDLRGNKISDLSPLMDLPNLQWLCIRDNSVSDLRPLMGLTRLYYLDAQNNSITSVSSVSSLSSLTNLYIGGNSLSSFAPIGDCGALKELGLENTGLTDAGLEKLGTLTNLTKLYLENNTELSQHAVDTLKTKLPNCKISHSELKSDVTLGSVQVAANEASVDASNQGISDITAAEKLTECTVLLLNDNRISDLSPLKNLTALRTLDLSNNKITDLTPLSTMTGLKSLNLEGNEITDVSPLLTMTWLTELYISGGNLPVEQIDALYESLPGCNITVEGYTP